MISREIRRNGNTCGYRPSHAQAKYGKRRENCRKKALEEGWLRETVTRLLTGRQWSPEEIPCRLAKEHNRKLVSSNTIYRALTVRMLEAKGTKKNQHGRYPIQKLLRRKGRKSEKKERKERTFIHQSIKERPKAVLRRRQSGHWEGNLVYSIRLTLVDRCSRYLLTGIFYSRKAEEAEGMIPDLLLTVPPKYRRTLMLDRSSEFSEHRR